MNDEANRLEEEWRALFREQDGEPSKQLRALKTKSIETRETAQEYQQLADEMEADIEDQQIRTAMARKEYLAARATAIRAYADTQLTDAARNLFLTEEAAGFFQALGLVRRRIALDVMEDRVLAETAPAYTSEGNTKRREAEAQRFSELLVDLVSKHAPEAAGNDPAQEEADILVLIEAGPHEIAYSPARVQAARRRKETLATGP